MNNCTNNDLISVVVPCYNVEKYLEKCVQSIVCQTYTNLEIILVDDGSKDSTPELCDKLALTDSRIKVVHKTNCGVSEARNTGIDVASGKYITFFDSDDWIEFDTIKIAYEKIIANSLDLIVWGYTADFVDDKENILKSNICAVKGVCEKNKATVLTQNYSLGLSGYVWNKIYSLDIIRNNKILFKSDISLYEDLLFNAQYYMCCKKIEFIDYIGNHYIQRNSLSLGTKRYENIFELKLMGCKARENILKYFDVEKHSVDKIMSYYYYGALKSAVLNIKTEPNASFEDRKQNMRKLLSDEKIQSIAKKASKVSLKQKVLVWSVKLRLIYILLKI